MIITLLSPEVREPTGQSTTSYFQATAHNLLVLEEYFSRSLGMALITLGIMTVLLTGSVPLTSSISESKSWSSNPKAFTNHLQQPMQA
jgi:hypothetical protein